MRKTLVSVLLAGTLAAGGALAFTSVSAGASTASASTAATSTSKGRTAHHPRLRRAIRAAVVRISAKTIGVTPKDLVAELKSGKSIADVANEHSVTPQSVVDALVKAGDNAIEKAVTAHRITRQRADKLEARLPALATKVVNKHFK